MLSSGYIDRWFQDLKRQRDVEIFIIISPHHYVQGTEYISLSSYPWNSGNGFVNVNNEVITFIKNRMGISIEDHDAFYYEHGIGTLTPYIKKYFPTATIVPILQREKPLQLERLEELGEVLTELIDTDPKGYFLMISTDFSHHFNLQRTLDNDKRSKHFLLNPFKESIIYAANDNIGGLYSLATVIDNRGWQKTSIIYNTNSLEISGEGADDITSYFFSFFY